MRLKGPQAAGRRLGLVRAGPRRRLGLVRVGTGRRLRLMRAGPRRRLRLAGPVLTPAAELDCDGDDGADQVYQYLVQYR